MNIISNIPIYRIKKQNIKNKCICFFGNIPEYNNINPKIIYVETLKISSKDRLNALISKYNIYITEKKMYDTYENYKGLDNDKDVQITLIICITYIYYLLVLLYIYMSFFG